MDRKSAIKTMIILATAPALIKIEMLMPVKTIVEVELIPMLRPLNGLPIIGSDTLKGFEEEPALFLANPKDYNSYIKQGYYDMRGYSWTADNL